MVYFSQLWAIFRLGASFTASSFSSGMNFKIYNMRQETSHDQQKDKNKVYKIVRQLLMVAQQSRPSQITWRQKDVSLWSQWASIENFIPYNILTFTKTNYYNFSQIVCHTFWLFLWAKVCQNIFESRKFLSAKGLQNKMDYSSLKNSSSLELDMMKTFHWRWILRPWVWCSQ